MNNHKCLFENIVLCQGDDATEPLEILSERGQEVAIEYLRQWHDPGHHEVRDRPSYGQWDNMYERWGYILTWNWRLG